MVRTLVLLIPFLSLACGSDAGMSALTGTGGTGTGGSRAAGGTGGAAAIVGTGGSDSLPPATGGAPGTGGAGGAAPGTGGMDLPGTGGGGGTAVDASAEPDVMIPDATPADIMSVADGALSCGLEALRTYNKTVATTSSITGMTTEQKSGCAGCDCALADVTCGLFQGERALWLNSFRVYISPRGIRDQAGTVLPISAFKITASRKMDAQVGGEYDFDFRAHIVADNLAKPNGTKVVTDILARIAGTCTK